MSTPAEASSDDGVLVGRCYTKARRHPLMIGKWPGGQMAIPGGPYTVPQVAVIAVTFAVLMLTRAVWAHFGLVNFVIALGVPYGLSLVVRHVHVDGRNPLLVAVSAGGAVAAPSAGRLGGRPVRPVGRYRPLVGVCSVTWADEAPNFAGAAEEPAVAEVAPAAARSAPGVAATGRPAAAGARVTAAAALLALRQEQMRARARDVDDERGV
ncbi:hypothetical protein [Streptomyces roseolus]|uniref:hypothetical protein n=1 Tax=Streptomyces roseolus TaxID=67358 RepID=UPI001671D08F|nr:hypothetical protein [Streptomyces roseolus]GGR67653.1 hypothetical protein GCM10010282_70680 [Streptomyces roseolus]